MILAGGATDPELRSGARAAGARLLAGDEAPSGPGPTGGRRRHHPPGGGVTMADPTWLAYSFAVLMVSVSVYCVGRLLVARRWGRRNHADVNISHVLMGFAMVGMLVPRWNAIPDILWESAFGAIALWFLALSVRFVRRHGVEGTDDDHVHHISHYLIHMVMSSAMLYMYWLGTPLTAPSGTGTAMMAGPPAGAGDPGLTLFIVAVLFASAVWQLDSVTEFSPRGSWLCARSRTRWSGVPGAGTQAADVRGWRLDSRSVATSPCASPWGTCSSSWCERGARR